MNESMDRALADWLRDGPDQGPREGLERALAAARQVSQRPAWAIPGRWLTMQLTMQRAPTMRPVLLLATVMVADTAALLAGRAFGRHRLAPALSPGKTVEGALAGLGGGVGAALAVRALGLPGLPLFHAIGLGLLVSAAGTAGDLFESLLKRWAGVKDSGTVFPGHGGMLDRLDSLTYTAPLFFHAVWYGYY